MPNYFNEEQYMLLKEAIKIMTEATNGVAGEFSALGISSKIEVEYMDKLMNPVTSSDVAKFVFLSVVISGDATNQNEYSMSLGAEIKGGSVNEEILYNDIKDFLAMADEVYERLANSPNIDEDIREMTKETSDEYSSFLESFPMADKKHKKTIVAVTAAVVFAVAAIVAVTILAFGG